MKISTILATHDKTDLVILLLHATAGSVFMAHGAQKLFSWFGVNGLEATGQWMNSIDPNPGYLMALSAESGEFFDGLAQLSPESDHPEE